MKKSFGFYVGIFAVFLLFVLMSVVFYVYIFGQTGLSFQDLSKKEQSRYILKSKMQNNAYLNGQKQIRNDLSIEENEKKHAKNYEILNEKIVNLQLEKERLLSENSILSKKLKSPKQNQNALSDKEISLLYEQLERLKKENFVLNLQNKPGAIKSTTSKGDDLLALKKKYDLLAVENEKNIKNLKEATLMLKSLNEENQALNAKNISLKQAKDANLTLQNPRNEIARLEDENSKLRMDNISLKQINENLKKDKSRLDDKNLQTTKQEPIKSANKSQKRTNKPTLLGFVRCDDMKKGTNSPTDICKNIISDFLDKYDTSYFYEVVPIVDEGGFASLKKVQKSSLGISNKEIQRLTRLSNLGIGKDRAKVGGDLIRDKFGESARISYAISNMNIPKKRGFVIRVYE